MILCYAVFGLICWFRFEYMLTEWQAEAANDN